ncbi:glutamyl-tRNA reductase [Thalassotalea aquiviva]|uniref:glutamyl-tRNA reductase n=1 Tax=Thalassotalea aquiviva TaxID=3242415 RepID=UPI003529FD96
MSIFTLGINHKTAPVAIREQISFPQDSLNEALLSAQQALNCREVVILSTCNRTEFYVSGQDINYLQVEAKLLAWLGAYHQIASDMIKPYLYGYQGEEAINHMMRVACGLDSLVLGEPQILGQMKQAYRHAKEQNTISFIIDRLFQRTFSVAKQVRTDTDIGANAISVAFAAVSLAKNIYSQLNDVNVLLVGAGETIELVSKHLIQSNVSQMTVANRSIERAEALAQKISANVISLSEIREYLPQADIVFSSTGSPLPIISKDDVQNALRKRKHKPIFMVDLAVPRDIEQSVDQLEDAFLYTVDDLQGIVNQNLEKRRQAALEAEQLVAQQAGNFLAWLNGLNANDIVLAYREQAMAQKSALLEKAMSQLNANKDPEQVMFELANKLANKLIHAPMSAIRTAAQNGEMDKVEYLSEALGFDKK